MTPGELSRPSAPRPLHVAIIMDGNGRWATARGMPRVAGHRAGAKAVRRLVEAAPAAGVGTLTLYAFSSDNWRRPPREVAALMRMFDEKLQSETPDLIKNGVRLTVIGRRDRLSSGLRSAISNAEHATSRGTRLNLRLAVDYSARDAIARAARLLAHDAEPTRAQFQRLLGAAYGGDGLAPDVDLLIRTGGEQRLSDFLLWECAYAELYFTECMWPEMTQSDLEEAVEAFHGRERRFGGIPVTAAAAG